MSDPKTTLHPDQSHIDQVRNALWQRSGGGASVMVGSGFSRSALKTRPNAEYEVKFNRVTCLKFLASLKEHIEFELDLNNRDKEEEKEEEDHEVAGPCHCRKGSVGSTPS